jgi:DNA end-binding protein Ku
VIPPDGLDEVPADGAKTTKRELEMAQQLIASLSGDFDPEKYRDEYRDRVLEMIERKAQGEQVVIEAAPERPREVPDLMAALEQSIAAAKGQGGGKRAKPTAKRSGSANGARSGGGQRGRKTAKKS